MYEDSNGVPYPPLRTHNFLRNLGVTFGDGDAPFSDSHILDLPERQPLPDRVQADEPLDYDENSLLASLEEEHG